MKKAIQKAMKHLPAIMACATLVLTFNANSTACFIFGQPKAPKGLDDFKRIK